ncbi:DegT/DnrJ/EryC1/StrS family aminotransferase [Vibrio sp.]|uniref:DegT/DnrJ/EryC1/StrS family aminotransferase n=1 Tax=Vibrio sp. TaxID=678 RepID=UPI00311E580A
MNSRLKPLKILPFEQYKKKAVDHTESKTIETNLAHQELNFTETAKDAISQIMKFHKLRREDETYIVTTSDSPFVSSCVTSTLFNFCKVSRVLTEKTKLIFVIHEFGIPCEKVESLYEIAQERNIPLVEDSAHSLTSKYKGEHLGKHGDYLIHSLPKTLPIKTGGLVIKTSDRFKCEFVQSEKVKKDFYNNLNYLSFSHQERIRQYKMYESLINKDLIYDKSDEVCPFCFGYIDTIDNVNKVYRIAQKKHIEILKTYNKNWVTIPLNPWYSENDINRILKLIGDIEINES